jgi:V/A-type H+-transporting ATPase subunit K
MEEMGQVVLGAAAAIGLAGAGSSIGIGMAGSKGAGVFAEKPHLFGKILLLTLLPGSQGVYGLVVAFLILFKAGIFGGDIVMTGELASKLFGAGLAMGVSGIFSGWFQGKVAAAGLGAVARDESLVGRIVSLAAVAETYAIFGLLIALLLLFL